MACGRSALSSRCGIGGGIGVDVEVEGEKKKRKKSKSKSRSSSSSSSKSKKSKSSKSSKKSKGGFGIDINFGAPVNDVQIDVDEPQIEVGINLDFGAMTDAELNANIEANINIDLSIDVNGWAEPVENQAVGWTGYFLQGGERYDMSLPNLTIGLDGAIIGGGSDSVGDFNISGQVAGDGAFSFNKAYVGAHTVIYEGQMNGTVLKGEWFLPDQPRDEFQIKLVSGGWRGWYAQSGSQNEMSLSMALSNGKIFGSGSDTVGNFVIQGRFNQGTTDFNFVKKYIGQHQVLYFGKATGPKSNLTVRGKWTIPDNCEGTFKLTQGY